MTTEEKIIHHESEYIAAMKRADDLLKQAAKLRALPPMPEPGVLTVTAAAILIDAMANVFDKENALMDAGLALIGGYNEWQALRL